MNENLKKALIGIDEYGLCGCVGPIPKCRCEQHLEKQEAFSDFKNLSNENIGWILMKVVRVCDEAQSAAGIVLVHKLREMLKNLKEEYPQIKQDICGHYSSTYKDGGKVCNLCGFNQKDEGSA